MTKTEKAWLAGFLDGEGSIWIYRQVLKDTKRLRYTAGVVITNTDIKTLQWIHTKLLGGSGDLSYWKPSKGHLGKKTIAKLRFETTAGKIILKELLPYLRVKKEHAKTVLELPDGRKVKSWDEHERLYRKIKKLNHGAYKKLPFLPEKGRPSVQLMPCCEVCKKRLSSRSALRCRAHKLSSAGTDPHGTGRKFLVLACEVCGKELSRFTKYNVSKYKTRRCVAHKRSRTGTDPWADVLKKKGAARAS